MKRPWVNFGVICLTIGGGLIIASQVNNSADADSVYGIKQGFSIMKYLLYGGTTMVILGVGCFVRSVRP